MYWHSFTKNYGGWRPVCMKRGISILIGSKVVIWWNLYQIFTVNKSSYDRNIGSQMIEQFVPVVRIQIVCV